MMDARHSAQDYFRQTLLLVVGQAFTAAGYHLQENPVQWAGGKILFVKRFEDGMFGFIEYQLLSYTDSEWASGMPSRFKVVLTLSDQSAPVPASDHAAYVRRDLSALVVEDFGVPILPSAAHWWAFRTTDELGHRLAESGHLVVGYGMPWLAGDLLPGDDLDR